MNWYLAKLEMASWAASAWQADTIFGHLCWGMRYLYGEEKLQDFLEWYENGMPPILLSNGFPGELMPAPLLPPESVAGAKTLKDQREEFNHRKNAKKVR